MTKREIEREMAEAPEELQEVVEMAAEADAEGEVFYRSQKEIDAVIGKRLHQERERWERQNAQAMLLHKAAGELPPEQAVAMLLARANGLDEGDVLEAMVKGESLSQIAELARESNLRRQADAVAAGDPGFELEGAMGNPAFRALVEAGEPVGRAYAYLTMDARMENERRLARDEMMRSIQARRTRPGVLRPAGTAEGADHMPDSVMRMIDERLKRGEKVRI